MANLNTFECYDTQGKGNERNSGRFLFVVNSGRTAEHFAFYIFFLEIQFLFPRFLTSPLLACDVLIISIATKNVTSKRN